MEHIDLVWIGVTVVVALIGGYIGIKLKLPAAALLGSMFAVGIWSLASGKAFFPQEAKLFTQMATGAFLGARITKQDVYALKSVIKPALILGLCMCAFGVGIAFVITHTTTIDIVTALFATAPAGIQDMTLASMDMGADASMVAILQLLRLISVVSLMPWIIRWLGKRVPSPGAATAASSFAEVITPAEPSAEVITPAVPSAEVITPAEAPPVVTAVPGDSSEAETASPSAPALPAQPNPATKPPHWFPRLVTTLLIALCAGWLGKTIGIPAGTISFSMIACAAYNIKTAKAFMPLRLRQFIQCFGGALIGYRITMSQVLSLRDNVWVVLIVVVGFILLCLVAAFFITRFTKLDPITALCASAPGGLTDMAIIAGDMGASSSQVAAMQLVRAIGVVALYPLLINLLLEIGFH